MDKRLEMRIVRIPDEIGRIQDETRKILEGISGWTKKEDYMQLKLLAPRLANLLAGIDTAIGETESCMVELEGDSNAAVTKNSLMQQKALLMKERGIIEDIRSDVALSSRLIEDSEKARLAGEILKRCEALRLSIKEMQ